MIYIINTNSKKRRLNYHGLNFQKINLCWLALRVIEKDSKLVNEMILLSERGKVKKKQQQRTTQRKEILRWKKTDGTDRLTPDNAPNKREKIKKKNFFSSIRSKKLLYNLKDN